MQIPAKLIEKYNKPVPRYTSYPPANFFTDGFDNDVYIEVLNSSNQEQPKNISIYIHIPFCPKICYYCGCNTHHSSDRNKMRSYVNAVKKEIKMVHKFLDPSRKVSQVHWGGGTPNSLPVEMVQEVMDLIHENFSFIENAEIAMECHPALLDDNYIEKLVASEFNRFSLGIQDFNNEVLKTVNRDPSVIPVNELVQKIRNYKNIAVNLDFIYGLPLQDEKTFSSTIQKAVDIAPDRLVTFSYAHVPWVKKAQKMLEKTGLPEADKKLAMFKAGYKILTDAGYTPIGLDHFAKENDDLSLALKNRTLHRNFQGYCTRETTGQVYAFGATGISQLENAYAQNIKETNTYIDLINQGKFTTVKGYQLTRKERVIRHVINEIMCNYFVSWNSVAKLFNTDVSEIKNIIDYNESVLNKFASDKLINFHSEETEVTETGRFFVRNIATAYDPNIKTATQKFSKAL